MSRVVSSSIRCTLAATIVVLLSGAALAADSVVAPRSAHRIQLSPETRSRVEEMMTASATFRAQYERVADAPFLFVSVRVDPALSHATIRARTTFRRYASGLVVAVVEVSPGAYEAEWIAHEFEHIVEQLDGLDVRRLAEKRGGAAWYSSGGLIETARASLAGRRVGDEIRASR